MGQLPSLPGRRVVRIFEHLGWIVNRQSGSHVILIKTGVNVTLSVPRHTSVAKGTLRTLIGKAGLSVDEFIAADREC